MTTEIRQQVSVKTKTFLITMTALAIFGSAMFISTLIKGIESFSQKVASDNIKFRNLE